MTRANRHALGKQFIAVTCHFDVLDWLEPDWIYNVDTCEFFDYTDVKKNDVTPKLFSQFINAAIPCGRSLGNITI